MSQYLESAKQSLTNALPSIPSRDEMSSNLSNTLSSVQSSVENTKGTVNSTLNEFSSKSVMDASSEYLNSNSIISKFAFLILLLIVFLFLLKVGAALTAYFLSPSKQPYLAKGVIQGTANRTISQDPANSKSAVIYRSNNQTGGIEFTWSVWIWVDGIETTANKQSHIFHKGNNMYFPTLSGSSKGGMATVNNGPGLYLGLDESYKPTNSLVFYLDVEKTSTAPDPIKLETKNIPLKKWFHIVYRVQNYSIDCYINGVLSNSVSIGNYVPKQNYDDVHIGKNGGFNGKLSNLRYYDYALSAFDINAITNYGPNLSVNGDDAGVNGIYDYISMNWYSSFQ